MSNEFKIRLANSNDAEGICVAHGRSIREVASKDYSPQQISGWSDRLKPDGYVNAMEVRGETMYVAELNGEILGFSSIKGSEVMAVYVSPKGIKRGVGRALYLAVEDFAKRNGTERLHLVSSLTPEGFYSRMGFVVIERTDHRFSNGIEIPCIKMEKMLAR